MAGKGMTEEFTVQKMACPHCSERIELRILKGKDRVSVLRENSILRTTMEQLLALIESSMDDDRKRQEVTAIMDFMEIRLGRVVRREDWIRLSKEGAFERLQQRIESKL